MSVILFILQLLEIPTLSFMQKVSFYTFVATYISLLVNNVHLLHPSLQQKLHISYIFNVLEANSTVFLLLVESENPKGTTKWLQDQKRDSQQEKVTEEE